MDDSLLGHSYNYMSREVTASLGRYVSRNFIAINCKYSPKLWILRAVKDSNFAKQMLQKTQRRIFGKMNQDNGK